MPTSLVIATTNSLVQHGLPALLNGESGIVIRAFADTVDGTIAALRKHRPNVLIIEPGLVPALQERAREDLFERMLLMSPRAHIGTQHPPQAGRACGFVSERASPRHLRSAIRMVSACAAKTGHGYCNSCPLRSTLEPPPLSLSQRELHVFRAIANGESTSQIAEELGLSVKTIETYRESIKRKLGLQTAHQLVEAALQWKQGESIGCARANCCMESPQPRCNERAAPARNCPRN